MGHKRVLIVGAIMVAAAIGAPAAAMLVPGGVFSGAPRQPPTAEVTSPPAEGSVPLVTDILGQLPAPASSTARPPIRQLDPAEDPVKSPPPERTPSPQRADRPAPQTQEPDAPPTPDAKPTVQTVQPAPPTLPAHQPEPADQVVVPPPALPDDPDPADQ